MKLSLAIRWPSNSWSLFPEQLLCNSTNLSLCLTLRWGYINTLPCSATRKMTLLFREISSTEDSHNRETDHTPHPTMTRATELKADSHKCPQDHTQHRTTYQGMLKGHWHSEYSFICVYLTGNLSEECNLFWSSYWKPLISRNFLTPQYQMQLNHSGHRWQNM